MFDFLKFSISSKRFKIKKGRIKALYEYKIKLVEDVKKLKTEKRSLTRKINQSKKEKELFSDLSTSVNELEIKKFELEKDIAQLFKAKELTLSIKELQKKETLVKSNLEKIEENKKKTEKDLNKLKEEKAMLIDEIDNLSASKEHSSNNSLFSIEYVDNLKDGLSFEIYFAKLLDKLGFYDIKITDGSGDFGIDVLAYNDDILYGFQCKLYSSTVGNKAVQEAYSGKVHYDCNVAVVVTNNYFTNQAIEQARETKVLLWDRNVLIAKLKDANKMNFTINI